MFRDPGFLLLISEFWNYWLSCAHHGFIWLGPGFVLWRVFPLGFYTREPGQAPIVGWFLHLRT